ncbi:hypothetical protein [Cohnella panacarvi]|uniref:hypothetical protein n=1 Tax=Cohnella panacarvi TaxID=400776 RepID=UPI00047E0321|nr:hypothetical protein [Cohnella panacarvi]
MLTKKLGYSVVALLLAVALVLSGCTKDKSPKDALQASLSTNSELSSYSFKGSMKFEEFNLNLAEMTEEDTTTMNMFKNAEVSWSGAYQKDPMLSEVELKLELKGDLAINFQIPIIATDKKLWVKVPNIAMLPIPEEMVGKYLELDLEQLAEQTGQEIPTLDPKQSQKFVEDLMNIVFKHLNADEYLSSVKAKDAGIPSDVDAKQVVQIHVKKAQIEPFLTTVVEKIAPEVLDLIANNKDYLDMTGMTKEDIDAAKEGLKSADSTTIKEGVAEMNKVVKNLDIVANVGIDKKDYPVYTDASVKAAFDSEGNTGSFAIKVVSQLGDVNEKVEFKYGQPKAEEIVSFEEAFGELGGLLGGASIDDL